MMSGNNSNSVTLSTKFPTQNLYIIFVTFLAILTASSALNARDYEAPPSDSTFGDVPWISDAEMERCVKLYNEANWLEEELNGASVDQYSQASVNAYNKKAERYSEKIDYFNRNCAGKQSESAYRAAQKLNQQQDE